MNNLMSLDNHEWNILSSRWSRGIDCIVYRTGNKWSVCPEFGAFPAFATKKAAYDAATTEFLAAARARRSAA